MLIYLSQHKKELNFEKAVNKMVWYNNIAVVCNMFSDKETINKLNSWYDAVLKYKLLNREDSFLFENIRKFVFEEHPWIC